MEALLEQVLVIHKSAMKDLACLELKNITLEDEVGELKKQIAGLTNRRCPKCGERAESIRSDMNQNVEPAECSQLAENLVFNDEADTTILRRQKRRKNREGSSQEQKKRRMDQANVKDDSPTVRPKTPEGHKLMRKLETENTQFPETLNPAKILVGQTCELDSNVNNERSVYKSDAECFDRISVIPETVPMDVEPDEEECHNLNEEQPRLKPVSDKSVVIVDTSDNDSLRDAPDSVRKMFMGSQTPDRTPKAKPPLLDFDTGGKGSKGDLKKTTPESKTRDGRTAKKLTPKSQKVKAGDVSTQFGYSQAFQFVLDLDSQQEERSDAEASRYSPVKKTGKGQGRNSKTNEFAPLEAGSDGSRSPVFNSAQLLNHVSDDKMDQVQQNSAPETSSKNSPPVSQGFKVGSNQSSDGSSDPAMAVNNVRISYDAKNLPLDKLSEGNEVRIDVTGNSETNSYIVGPNGIKKDKSVILDDMEPKNVTNPEMVLESVNTKSQSSINSQESEASGSQSLVSSRMSINRSSNRRTGAELNSSGEKKLTRSMAQSRSDSHLLQKKKSKSDQFKSVGGPSPIKSKHSSLPNSPLNVSQTLNTKFIATEARNSDDEFKSDAGFRNSAEEVWLSAKKPEPKKHRVKAPPNVTLNTTLTSSPKNFRQQTIDLTLKKNTEKDLSEAVSFNGGVLSSKKSNGAEKVDAPNLSFEFDEDEEEVENVPPSPQKPMLQKFRRPKTFATGAKTENRQESHDVTFDPDMTRLPPSAQLGSEVTGIDARPSLRKTAASPIGTTETNFHDSEMDTSYSLLPAVKYNGTIDPDLNLSAYVDSVVPNNDPAEMSEQILSNSGSIIFGKDGNVLGNNGSPATVKKGHDSLGVNNVPGRSARSVADPLLCAESNLSEEVPFHSTCRSVTFGKGGTVSAGLPPNFSELASEIPQNSEFPVAHVDEISVNRRNMRNRSRLGKPKADLLDSDMSASFSQSSKLGSRKAKNRSQKKSPKKPCLLLNPDYDSQLDFAGQDSEKSIKFSSRPKRGSKSQETAPSTVSRKLHSKIGQKKFEASHDSNVSSKSFKSRKSKRSLNETLKHEVSAASGKKGPRFTMPNETSYILTEKQDDAVMVAGKGGHSEYDDDVMMADMCKSMKFGARPKTFAAEPQSPDELDNLLSNANIAGSHVIEGNENQKDVDHEEDSQGMGDDDDYPCPGIVATPVDESEKSVSRRRRKEMREEQRLMDNSFDRVPKDAGPDYAHCKVERNRQKRAHCMHGHDCAGCKDYYDDLPEDERNKRMQESSRHRAYYVPPDTPPGFWCLNIPSTQSLSTKMKGHLDESYSAGLASVKSPEQKPGKGKKDKFRRKNKLTILPPKFDDKS